MTQAASRAALEPDRPKLNEKYCAFKLRIAKSKVHRWGVFAMERIPMRRKVMEYTGEKLNRLETKRRSDERALHYLFTLNSYWTIDGAVGGSGAEFVNHSCDPNLWVWICRDHILYMSRRAIEPGEELTIDYHFAKDVERVECKCGSTNCRGTINLLE